MDDKTPDPDPPDHPAPARPKRSQALQLVMLLLALACLGSAATVIYRHYNQPGVQTVGNTDASDQADPTGRPSANPDRLSQLFDLAGLRIDLAEIHDGGPGIDGIPTLTTAEARDSRSDPAAGWPAHDEPGPPVIVPLDQADFLDPGSRVVGLTINGQSRAYPINVLVWHECVNDVLGGVPIAVTFCPLCDSVTVIGRQVGEGDDAVTLDFGISGFLHNSNVLLYDRQERSLWSQIRLEAICGPRVGTSLTHLPGWSLTTFEDWTSQHPDSDVLSYETGYSRRYDAPPYAGYADNQDIWFPVADFDDRLPIKQRIIGVRHGGESIAIVLPDEPERTEHTFADGSTLIIDHDGQGGITITQQPEDAQLIHTFWYAWCASHPETSIIE